MSDGARVVFGASLAGVIGILCALAGFPLWLTLAIAALVGVAIGAIA